jgi:hypothetical protein
MRRKANAAGATTADSVIRVQVEVSRSAADAASQFAWPSCSSLLYELPEDKRAVPDRHVSEGWVSSQLSTSTAFSSGGKTG